MIGCSRTGKVLFTGNQVTSECFGLRMEVTAIITVFKTLRLTCVKYRQYTIETMMTDNIISRDVFLKNKKEQQRKLWYDGYLSDREFVDWLLVHGDDSDVEWLSTQLDEDFDAPTDPVNDNT